MHKKEACTSLGRGRQASRPPSTLTSRLVSRATSPQPVSGHMLYRGTDTPIPYNATIPQINVDQRRFRRSTVRGAGPG